jgi:16S rRNA (adenine1518-N6/adenine1519-N6)-dimethyltransferase
VTVTDPGRQLRAHGLRPAKALGQHFLRDRSVVTRIVDLLDPGPEDVVVEIGAGLGALTRELAARGARVVAVERDETLCRVLRAEMGQGVTIERADARELDLGAYARYGRVLVAGNIPYNISSELVLLLVEQRAAFRVAVLMVQAEFAARLAAPPGREQGALSVRCQQHLEVLRAFQVAPGCFHPPPRVRSTVVRLVPRPAPLAQVADDAAMERLVRDAFSKRRKTLRNALGPRAGLDEALDRSGIDGRRRPETLSIAEFARLTDELCRSFPK